ncbi:cupin domain-containing protein [Rhodobacteraceae bacterium RKSG542]|uniref:cupin domain-containing protein n=1 Tax=Pseudovibrio flavus TaxID=2529854 RepID=UPI00352840C9|nr:cupin domain-containing protein [Pseudovibrio flavus]
MAGPSAQDIIKTLNMKPHPEGGYYTETFRDEEGPEGRGYSTCIYYLLEAGDRSHWHHVDAVEVWHYYAGAPLELSISVDGKTTSQHRLGPDVLSGERPQAIVPRHGWQSARSLGPWTLVGCTVSPGFSFGGFVMAEPDWQPAG